MKTKIRTIVAACLVCGMILGANRWRVAAMFASGSCPESCCPANAEGCEDPEDYKCCAPKSGEAACSSTCPNYCFADECEGLNKMR